MEQNPRLVTRADFMQLESFRRMDDFKKSHPEEYQINGRGDFGIPGGYDLWLKDVYAEAEQKGFEISLGGFWSPYIPLQMTKLGD